MKNWENGLHLIPGHMAYGLRKYIENGIPPGGFLSAVICNNLFLAYGRADEINKMAMPLWIEFFVNYAPNVCWGSEEAMKNWMARGGLNGIQG